MKITILGIEVSEGVSSKTKEAYSIGTLHTMIELAPARGKDNVNRGFAGDKMQCDVALLRKLQSLPFPITADVTTKPQMMFGERRELVVDVLPVQVERKAA